MESRGIVLFGTSDPEVNTTPPTGVTNSGWELQGFWSFFNGTPIGPHHFITAAHVGGTVGDPFFFQEAFYTTVSTAKDPGSDLQIWEVRETFPAFAKLYDGVTETGLELFVFGRGRIRGEPVMVNSTLKGWAWGVYDLQLRWGRNRVSSVIQLQGQPTLQVNFDSNGGTNEAHLATGDSGGGLFIQQSGEWRLAGINWTTDGPYNTTPTGAGFDAAIFDEGGLYVGGSDSWQLIADIGPNRPGSFYSTQIRGRLSWIQSILALPTTPILLEATEVDGVFAAATGAVVDAVAKTIRIAPSGTRFYRLQSSGPVSIESVSLEGTSLVIHYQ